MIVKIYRVEEGEETFGVMTINEQAFCVTLEPPDKDNMKNISNIPPGQYVCKRIDSPTFGETFEITDVPGRSHVLFHAGNTVHHTKGCVILGQYFGKLKKDRAVLNSGATFWEFMKKMNGIDTFQLEIKEVY